MNPNKIINSIKKHKFLSLAVLFSLASIAFILYSARLTTPPTPTPPSQTDIVPDNPDVQKMKADHIVIPDTTVFPPIPNQFNVYSAASSSPNFAALAKDLASAFNLNPSPNLENYYINNDRSASVFIDVPGKAVIYNLNSFKNPQAYEGTNPPNIEASIKAANQFIQSYSDLKNLIPDPEHITYLEYGDSHVDPISPQQASLIQLPLAQQIDGLPVYYSSQINPPLTLLFGQNSKIVKATIYPQPITYSSPQAFTSLSRTELETELSQGKAVVLMSESVTEPIPTLTDLPQINIHTVSFEYRYHPGRSQLIPYFRLTGTYSSPNRNLINIILIHPAIKLP